MVDIFNTPWYVWIAWIFWLILILVGIEALKLILYLWDRFRGEDDGF
jgi:hypothetical protein